MVQSQRQTDNEGDQWVKEGVGLALWKFPNQTATMTFSSQPVEMAWNVKKNLEKKPASNWGSDITLSSENNTALGSKGCDIYQVSPYW